ncbi:hypothetical protein MTO96_001524 [Rhipicephalus appendiculatus]
MYRMEIVLSKSGLEIDLDCLEEGTVRVRRLPALFNAGDVALLVDSTGEMQALLKGMNGCGRGFSKPKECEGVSPVSPSNTAEGRFHLKAKLALRCH